MIINSHTAPGLSANSLAAIQSKLGQSLSRLSSGRSILSPADDAGGLAIGSQFDSEIGRVNAASDNVGHAISFVQTQDAYLKRISDTLNRMSELTLSAQDATKSDNDRALFQKEYSQLSAFVSGTTQKEFNGVSLFSGNDALVTLDSFGNTLSMDGISLGSAVYSDALNSAIDTVSDARDALDKIKLAIQQVARDRSAVGAYENRLSASAEQLMVNKDNLSAASSRIQDVDVATESTEYARRKILLQSGTAMLAQANALPAGALRLLQ